MPGNTRTVYGTDLRWRRVYTPNARQVIYQDLDVEGGTYRLRPIRKNNYKVSWIARKGDSVAEEVDLGQYRTRRESDERVLQHRGTGI